VVPPRIELERCRLSGGTGQPDRPAPWVCCESNAEGMLIRLAEAPAPQTRARPRSRTETGLALGEVPLPIGLDAHGARPEDRTLLQRCVGPWPSPEGEPRVVGAAGVEPASACSRSTWPTASLDPGRSNWTRTSIRGFKGRRPSRWTMPPSSRRTESNRVGQPYESCLPPRVAAVAVAGIEPTRLGL
jgi:hypothetical protein